MASKELKIIIEEYEKARNEIAESYLRIDRTSSKLELIKNRLLLKLITDFLAKFLNSIDKNLIISLVSNVDIKQDILFGRKCEIIFPKECKANGVIIYLHGGAFLYGSLETHRHLCAQISKICKCAVLQVDYSLGKTFPIALEECLNIYFYITNNINKINLKANNIFIAGGNLTLSLLLKLKKYDKRQPTGAITFSASTDETRSLNSWVSNAKNDVMLGCFSSFLVKNKGESSEYTMQNNPKDPLISPIYGDLSGLAPILMQVGDCECLLDESKEFSKRANLSGTSAIVEVWDDMLHVWQIYAPYLPEALDAINSMYKFMLKVCP